VPFNRGVVYLGPGKVGIDISINKAFTARAFDISTAQLAENSQPGQQFLGPSIQPSRVMTLTLTISAMGSLSQRIACIGDGDVHRLPDPETPS
jgi:hypothetical protein